MKSPNILLSIVAAVTMTFGVSTFAVQGQGTCSGDINGDGLVNGVDMAFVLSAWGVCPGTITSVTPLQGSILGGTQITINGTNLAGTTAVKVGGVTCTNLQVLSPTVVKAVTPAGAAGEVSIAVVTIAGTLLAPSPFSYVQMSIESVFPSRGIYSGGTTITITGSFLNGATSVKVGGVPATNVVIVNLTTLTAVTPAGSLGAASVEVTDSKETATATNVFTYISIAVPPWATLLESVPDPAVVTDANLRAAIVETGFAWRILDTSSNIEMLLVPPGTFTMGCSSSSNDGCSANESPTHQVTLTNAFYLGRYEVTQAQWLAEIGSNPSRFQGARYPDSASRPVEQVSWNMIEPFCTQNGLRLPTEAEWEYSYRAGTTTAFHSFSGYPNGTNEFALLGNIAWSYSNSGNQTHAVGGKSANALGMHDMAGNAAEWCQDWYGPYAAGSVTNPTGPTTGKIRSLRGGSFSGLTAYDQRASVRDPRPPDIGPYPVGFRAARNP